MEGEVQYRQQEAVNPPDGFPEKLKEKRISTKPGRAADIIDSCCDCYQQSASSRSQTKKVYV